VLSFETAGVSRFPATNTRFPVAAPLLGDHLCLSCEGHVIYIPCRLLFVSAGVNYFLDSGGLRVGAAKGMSKVRRAKRFELINKDISKNKSTKVSWNIMAEM
jgi:hypothetical protein